MLRETSSLCRARKTNGHLGNQIFGEIGGTEKIGMIKEIGQ